jgi:hypothetical protein
MNESAESLVTVFETGNRIEFETAKILLRDAGIEFFTVGEEVQDLIALGRIGTGQNPVTGPTRIQVRAEDEAEARRILEEMDRTAPEA